jgi:hypothetical protein
MAANVTSANTTMPVVHISHLPILGLRYHAPDLSPTHQTRPTSSVF